MTSATASDAVRPSRTPAARLYRATGSLVIASINRGSGITGVHTHTDALRAGLMSQGCGCSVVSPFDDSRIWELVFALRPLVIQRISRTAGTLHYRFWHEVALRSSLAKHLRHNPADVVLAQCPVTAHAAIQVRRQLGLSFRIALVCHFNHSEADEYRRSGDLPSERAYQRMLAYEAAVLRDVDQVIYVSEWARHTVETERKIQPRASAVIHNGIPDVGPQRAVPRESLGLAESDLVLVNVGTLEPRKNQIGLLDLFERIAGRHPQARLLLVGAGHQQAQIERSIRDKKLTDKVRLLGKRPDVPAILSISDLYLHYAKLENCPVVLLEAARAGLPFAAVAAGGIPELQAGLNINLPLDPDNLDQSMAVLEPVLGDANHRRALGAQARKAFAARFTTEAMTRNYLGILGLSAEQRG